MGSRGLVAAASIATTVIVLGAASCLSFGDLSGGDTDAGNDGSISSNDGSLLDSETSNDTSLPNDGSGETGDSACKGTAGSDQVRVGSRASSFCIDSTEVSIRDYRVFLASIDGGGGSVTQLPECAWNTNFGGSIDDPFRPVTEVDWCDAYAYCAWAGKHLCGAIGGGALAYDDSIGDPKKSEWLNACSHAPDGGVQEFPYGDTASATACNGSERDAGTTVEVGSLASCDGGAPDVFDMSGNVDEWEDSCDHATGQTDCCVSVGGGFRDFETSCGVGDVASPSCPGRTRADAHSDLGFRCCSD